MKYPFLLTASMIFGSQANAGQVSGGGPAGMVEPQLLEEITLTKKDFASLLQSIRAKKDPSFPVRPVQIEESFNAEKQPVLIIKSSDGEAILVRETPELTLPINEGPE